jgi:hypothetical protein
MTSTREEQAPAAQTLPKPGAVDALRGLGVLYAAPLAIDAWWAASFVAAMGHARVRGRGRAGALLRPVAAAGLLAPWFHSFVVRPRILFWGATGDEIARKLPGDNIVTTPTASTTRALTIDAPPASVWVWLVQIGYERGGWYSYDALEKAAGAGDFVEGRSATHIHSDLQELRPGDLIKMSPWTALTVVGIDPGKYLVLGGEDSGSHLVTKSSWAFVLEPHGDGATRLIVRERSRLDPRDLVQRLFDHLLEVPHFLMERKMLLGIKERAERGSSAG